MNTLFLVAAATVAFVFGYRFYAKLLTLDVFRLDPNYSTRAQSRPDGQDYVPTHRHLLLGHHVAAVSGVTAFAAPAVALAWGWIPVFLWIMIGTTVAAGTYALGSFWLTSRHPEDLGRLAAGLIGRRARILLLILAVAALLILIAASVGLTATLLTDFPGAVLPVVVIAFLAWVLGAYLHGRAESVLLPTVLVAFVLSLLLIWLLGDIRLGFNGALVISLADHARISIDGVVVWVVLLLVYAFHAARMPVWKLMRPRGFLIALTLVLMLVLFYAAIIVQHPLLLAPEFHSPPSTTSALPWLFLAVGAGALAGWQLLIVRGVTGRELRRETDSTYVGYGAALIQGLIALSAVLLGATAFVDRNAWSAYYATAPDVSALPRAVTFYIDSYAQLVAALGLDTIVARYFAATVVASLSLSVLEAAVRTLKNILIEIAPPGPTTFQKRDGQRLRLWLVVLAGGILALHDGRGLGGVTAWPLLALVSLWLAAGGFGLIALALRRVQQPVALVLSLAVVVAAVATWSGIAQAWSWWEAEAWIKFGAVVVVLSFAVFLAYDVISVVRRPLPSVSRSDSNLDT